MASGSFRIGPEPQADPAWVGISAGLASKQVGLPFKHHAFHVDVPQSFGAHVIGIVCQHGHPPVLGTGRGQTSGPDAQVLAVLRPLAHRQQLQKSSGRGGPPAPDHHQVAA